MLPTLSKKSFFYREKDWSLAKAVDKFWYKSHMWRFFQCRRRLQLIAATDTLNLCGILWHYWDCNYYIFFLLLQNTKW